MSYHQILNISHFMVGFNLRLWFDVHVKQRFLLMSLRKNLNEKM